MTDIKFKFVLEYTETKIKKLSRAYMIDEFINNSPLDCIMDDFEEIMNPYSEELDAYIGGEFVVHSKILSTGLHDKNGVEIYAGDILFGREEGNGETTAWTDVYVAVFFNDKYGRWQVRTKESEITRFCDDLYDFIEDYEVVSNIYENHGWLDEVSMDGGDEVCDEVGSK